MPDEALFRDPGASDSVPLPPVYTRFQTDGSGPEPALVPAPPFPRLTGALASAPAAAAPADVTATGSENAGAGWIAELEADAAEAGVYDVAELVADAGPGDPWEAGAPETEFPVDSLFLPGEAEPRAWPGEADEPAPFDVWDSVLGRIDEVADCLEDLARRLRDDASTLLGTEFGDDRPLERLLVDAVRRYLEGA